MAIYRIEREDARRRAVVHAALDGLDLVTADLREAIVTAWVSVWASSTHDAFDNLPYSPDLPDFSLVQHVNEVCRTGLDLARRAEAEWARPFTHDTLVPIFLLHDVDKPLLYERRGGEIVYSQLSRELPHGVVGAMLLRELGFDDLVVATVATHAVNAPFHGSTHAAYVLHYADLFSSDRALSESGKTPFYQRHFA